MSVKILTTVCTAYASTAREATSANVHRISSSTRLELVASVSWKALFPHALLCLSDNVNYAVAVETTLLEVYYD